MTVSILGRCKRTGRLGIAITSSSPAVASRCAFVAAGDGVAASQNVTDPRLGPALLRALHEGSDARAAVASVAATAPHVAHRQLAVVDRDGRAAAYSGSEALGTFGERPDVDCVVVGNLLASEDVLDAGLEAFRAAGPDDELEERLLVALEAAVAAGGEAGPVHSAGLLASGLGEATWPATDLRVDFDPDGRPAEGLRRLWGLWQPQRDDYVMRALDPTAAPSYGVPGDEDRRHA